jgi:hypothetical protein
MIYTYSKIPKQISIQDFDAILCYCLDTLELPDDLMIRIVFKDRLPVLGYVMNCGDYFEIELLTSQKRNIMLETLAHECKHIEQQIKGDNRAWDVLEKEAEDYGVTAYIKCFE